MNAGRIFLTAAVATVVDAVYGFVVYGNLLQPWFTELPAVYRQADTAATYMPVLFGGTFLAMLAASYIYTKGYEGGSGVKEGFAFGAAIGVLAVGYTSIVNFATLNIPADLGMSMAAAALVEWILAGIVIGVVYRPQRVRAVS